MDRNARSSRSLSAARGVAADPRPVGLPSSDAAAAGREGQSPAPRPPRCAVDGCGRRMKTQYWGREGVARTATYTCLRQNGWGDATHQVTVPARYVDHGLVEHVLAALIALDTDTARAVIERSQRDSATLERAQRRRLLDAEEDVEKLLQLLKNMPPELQSA